MSRNIGLVESHGSPVDEAIARRLAQTIRQTIEVTTVLQSTAPKGLFSVVHRRGRGRLTEPQVTIDRVWANARNKAYQEEKTIRNKRTQAELLKAFFDPSFSSSRPVTNRGLEAEEAEQANEMVSSTMSALDEAKPGTHKTFKAFDSASAYHPAESGQAVIRVLQYLGFAQHHFVEGRIETADSVTAQATVPVVAHLFDGIAVGQSHTEGSQAGGQFLTARYELKDLDTLVRLTAHSVPALAYPDGGSHLKLVH